MDIFVYSNINIRLIEQLRVFVAVAERQHVTQAAQALNLAQSAASHAIAALEAEHGTKLFSRIGRGIVLTEAGRALLDEARAVLAQAERAELVLSEFGSLKRGTLLVQASQTIAGYWLPRHLANFRRAHPDIDIRLAIGNTAQVAATVDNGATELRLVEGSGRQPASRKLAGRARSARRRRCARASLGQQARPQGQGSGAREVGATREGLGHALGVRGYFG
jgi:DNA-binding transcriptional LysR family regulator